MYMCTRKKHVHVHVNVFISLVNVFINYAHNCVHTYMHVHVVCMFVCNCAAPVLNDLISVSPNVAVVENKIGHPFTP